MDTIEQMGEKIKSTQEIAEEYKKLELQVGKMDDSIYDIKAKVKVQEVKVRTLQDKFKELNVDFEIGRVQPDIIAKCEHNLQNAEKELKDLYSTLEAREGATQKLRQESEALAYSLRENKLRDYLKNMQQEINQVNELNAVVNVLQQKITNINSIGNDIHYQICKNISYSGAAFRFKDIADWNDHIAGQDKLCLFKINKYLERMQDKIDTTLSRIENGKEI